jgi:DNA-binding NarL/FixJ family response regulator
MSKAGSHNTTDIWVIEGNEHYNDELTWALMRRRQFGSVKGYYTCESALDELSQGVTGPNLILLDFYFPGLSGSRAVLLLRRYVPKAKIILLTGYEYDRDISRAMKFGAAGYVPMGCPTKEIFRVINACVGGKKSTAVFTISRILSMNFLLQAEGGDLGLTSREREILRYLSKETRQEKIADDLGIECATVHSYLRNIHQKLHACCDSETIVRAFLKKHGIMPKQWHVSAPINTRKSPKSN